MTDGKFGKTSRYLNTPVATRETADGVQLRYLRRRFLPQPEALPLGYHTVVQDDRLDRIAAGSLGDPQLWWRIADSNLALDPDELTRDLGRSLTIAIEDEPPIPDDEGGQPT
ncbi:MAG: hypothetical protein V2I82_11520 [Halieaceae bacterium]|jgi:hypothetical protein|nr:hypothetical protein [Halieaceae bacterium]